MSNLFLLSTFSLFFLHVRGRTRITCIGDSITEGADASNREETRWTSVLQDMLGTEDYLVSNFGKSGRTLTNTKDAYRDTEQWEDAKESEPDIVIIGLGTNDAKDRFWYDFSRDLFVEQYETFVEDLDFDDVEEWIILVPIPNLKPSSKWTDPDVINVELPVRVRRVAENVDATLVDLQPSFYDGDEVNEDMYGDAIHPNDAGHYAIAAQLYTELTGNPPPPTPRPTHAPTHSPTYQPTYSPTYSPTTAMPTHRPTHRPTERPTYSPTYSPTEAPTKAPAPKPTTPMPTRPPTIKPTFSPTPRPIPAQTSQPTPRPSTPAPTLRPTPKPTFAPSRSPTLSPTGRPTTPSPSAAVRPTGLPTSTMMPSTTSPTSSSPTMAPTFLVPTSSAPSVATLAPSFTRPTPSSPVQTLAPSEEQQSLNIVDISSSVLLENVDAEAFNADPAASDAFAEAVLDSIEMTDGSASSVFDVVATTQTRRRRRRRRLSEESSSKVRFVVRAATIVSEELDDIRDDVVEDLSSSFVDGSFDETLAKSDSSALANATVAVDESTRLVEEETTVNLVPQRTDAPTPSPLQPSSSGGSSKSGSSGSQILIIILCFIVFLCLCVVLVIVLIVRGRRRSQLVESSGASEEEVRRYLEQHGSFVETNKESVVKAHPSTPMKEARIETIAPSIYAEEGKQETGSEVFHKSVSFNDTPLSSDYVGVSCADTPPEEEVSSEEEDEAGEDPRRSGARRRLY